MQIKEHPSVQAWSRTNSRSLWHRDFVHQALAYLSEVTIFRSTALNLYVDDFKPEPEDALPHLQMFLCNSARSLATAWDIQRIRRDFTVLEAAQTLLQNEVVVIKGETDGKSGEQEPDVLWSRKSFFYKLLTCTEFEVPVSTIIEDVQEMPTLNQTSTSLDEVLRVMCVTHVEVVGLVDDQGAIVRVISFGDIVRSFVKELQQIYQNPGEFARLQKEVSSR